MKILFVDKNRVETKRNTRALRAEGYSVEIAHSLSSAFERIGSSYFDLIIVDLSLPDGNGIALIRRVRSDGHTVPILVVTAQSDLHTKATAFRATADDYVVKPVSTLEIILRAQALLRRGPVLKTDLMRIADIELNRTTHIVKRSGKRISLMPKEFSLLEYLMLQAGRIVSREMITEQAWNEPFQSETNIVDVYVGHLRKKIDAKRKRSLIRTIRTKGYSMELPA